MEFCGAEFFGARSLIIFVVLVLENWKI